MNAGSEHDEDEAALIAFGKRVRAARKRLGMEQEELADMLGTDAGTISRWERGKGYPQAPQLARLAKALGDSVDYLLLGAPSPSAPAPMPRTLIEFLQTRHGRIAQRNEWVHTLLSVQLKTEPSMAFYRAMVRALEDYVEELIDDDDPE